MTITGYIRIAIIAVMAAQGVALWVTVKLLKKSKKDAQEAKREAERERMEKEQVKKDLKDLLNFEKEDSATKVVIDSHIATLTKLSDKEGTENEVKNLMADLRDIHNAR